MSGLSSHLNFASSKVILALPGFVEYFSVPLKFLDFGRGILPGGIRVDTAIFISSWYPGSSDAGFDCDFNRTATCICSHDQKQER